MRKLNYFSICKQFSLKSWNEVEDGGKYVGTSRERAVWWKTKSSGEKYVVNICVWESPIEISSITPNRMEGRVLPLHTT
jgi:hypothetical protein